MGHLRLSREKKNPEDVREISIIRQDITLLLVFCNPNDNFDFGLDGRVLMLTVFH